MNQYLKSYEVIVQTAGPVFIGSGREIGKKEYIFLTQDQAGIPDIQKLYQFLTEKRKTREFEEYLLGYSRDDLTVWLRKQKIKIAEILPFIKYTLDCEDAIIERGTKLQVMECIKDAFGNPYIPGSSLKGMFRTILLSNDIMSSPVEYQSAKAALKRNVSIKAGRNSYLSKDISRIEGTAFRTLGREHTKPFDAVNDCMQGFIVSDSEPLPISSLVLCQKVELHTNGTEKRLPILRECIKPGTEIRFTITIDTSVCKMTARMLVELAGNFMNSYYKNFAAAFPGIAPPKENHILLGGGCGFASKTMIYPMYGKQEGLEVTQKIFDNTLGKLSRTHKHDKDRQFGASPHILKCTKYRGKTVQMGLCSIKKVTPQNLFSPAL